MPITEQILITAKCDLCENTLTSATHDYVFEQGWREIRIEVVNRDGEDGYHHNVILKTLCPIDFDKFKKFLRIGE